MTGTYHITAHPETYGYLPRECDICGCVSSTENTNAHVEELSREGWGKGVFKPKHIWKRTYVCDDCIESGPTGIRRTLLKRGKRRMAEAVWSVIPLKDLIEIRQQQEVDRECY